MDRRLRLFATCVLVLLFSAWVSATGLYWLDHSLVTPYASQQSDFATQVQLVKANLLRWQAKD